MDLNMAITERLSSNIRAILVGFLLFIICLGISAQNIPAEYREKVDLHIGRVSYVAGELIPYKAYGSSNADNLYSQSLYVELVDANHQHVAGQILKLENKSASGILELPDTIQTGQYYIKAYTQWMRNFSTANFFSQPVMVFNKYDEEDLQKVPQDFFGDPQLFLEHGSLIAGVSTRGKVHFPMWLSGPVDAEIRQKGTSEALTSFRILAGGTGSFKFTPKENTEYELALLSGKSAKTFELPEVSLPKPVCTFISKSDSSFLYSLAGTNGEKVYRLIFKDIEGGILQESFPVKPGDTTTFELNGKNGTLHEALLTDSDNNLVSKYNFQIIDNEKEMSAGKYNSGEWVQLNPKDLIAEVNWSQSQGSVSVYKASPGQQVEFQTENSGGLYDAISSSIGIILPEVKISSETNVTTSNPDKYEFLVEDNGILYTGKVINLDSGEPEVGIDVILALDDTIASAIASQTDENGAFTFVLEDHGNADGIIDLYKNGARLNGNRKIILDNKFHFDTSIQEDEIPLTGIGDEMYKYLTDESDRVLIQRAFNHINNSNSQAENLTAGNDKPFYGEPILVVYPQEYFELPNFEEVAREVLPRVRYNKSKKGCEMVVTHVENGLRSTTPLVFVDGIPIKSYCEIHPLRSTDIQRIEVQSGERISGNLVYNGLVAIYTTDEYRRAHGSLADNRTVYSLKGYENSTEILEAGNSNETIKGRVPDFRNQLFWSPEIGEDKLKFRTSDEQGIFVIDVMTAGEDGKCVQNKSYLEVGSN